MTRRPAEARAFLSSRAIELDLSGPACAAEDFEVRYNGVYFPGMWLGYIHYGVGVTARIPPLRDDFWIQIPLQGHLASSLGVQCDRGLLLSQPSNYWQALRKRARPIALGYVVRECGVPGRTLLKHFQDFKGVSPMRYLRNLRLQHARESLQAGRVARVSDVVSHLCFGHAGRFSIEYRRRFGESPSRTLAKRKST